jgi:hypothetical protein
MRVVNKAEHPIAAENIKVNMYTKWIATHDIFSISQNTYFIAKPSWKGGGGYHAHMIGHFPLFLGEINHVCSTIKFSKFTYNWSENENIIYITAVELKRQRLLNNYFNYSDHRYLNFFFTEKN